MPNPLATPRRGAARRMLEAPQTPARSGTVRSRTATHTVTALALFLLAAGAATELAAQAGRVQVGGEVTRRIENISPNSGPPGTTVTVSSGLMPAITPVRIGLGATRFGFEALAELLTSDRGEFSVPIAVPEWARPDRTHRFIVFDFYFNPIALSDPFFVTDENGRLRREGRLTDEGERCPALRDVDNQLFTLVGDLSGFGEGDRVLLEATLAGESEACGQAQTLRVVTIRAAPGR